MQLLRSFEISEKPTPAVGAMMIVRSRHRANYTILSNTIFESGLSPEAVGVLANLISKPADWTVRIDSLAKLWSCSKGRMSRIMKEIRAAGFAETRPTGKPGKFGGSVTIIYDTPAALRANGDTVQISSSEAPQDADKAAVMQAESCPHAEVIDLYHEMLPELQKVVKSRWGGSQRARDLLARWREDERHQDLQFWKWFFEIVRTNPHWLGENGRGWKADLAWLLRRQNFDKVLERGVSLQEAGR